MRARVTPFGGPASPLYYQLAARVRDRIQAGELPPHAPVPSERRMSEEYGVSRMTARQALATLAEEGYVYRDGRRGTFVAEPRIELRIGSFSDEVERGGRRPGARVLSVETVVPTQLVREALGLGVGERVHLIQRLRLADGEPLAIENTSLPEALCPTLPALDLSGSLWRLLAQRFGVQVARADASVEAVAVDRFESERLAVPRGSAGVLLTRVTFTADGRPVEFARDVYRGDRAAFRVQATIPGPEATEAGLVATVSRP